MTNTVTRSRFFLRVILGLLPCVAVLVSCGKKEAAPTAAEQASVAPELPVNVPRELQEYKDPKGVFVVMLPKGYVFSDKTVGDKPKYIFTYGTSLNLIITQGPAAADWDNATEMSKKQDEIRTGTAGFPPNMSLVKRELLSFGGLKGFCTLLGGNLAGQETEMMAYYLAAEEKLFTLIVTWKDRNAAVLNEQVKSSITNSFRLASFTKPAPEKPKPEAAAKAPTATNAPARPAVAVVKPKPEPVAPPPEPVDPRSESDWMTARNMLKFTGSMKMGGQQVAMVNNKILRKGDAIAVMVRDTEFVFIVSEISANGVEYKRKLQE